jgi:hypothetical protein
LSLFLCDAFFSITTSFRVSVAKRLNGFHDI